MIIRWIIRFLKHNFLQSYYVYRDARPISIWLVKPPRYIWHITEQYIFDMFGFLILNNTYLMRVYLYTKDRSIIWVLDFPCVLNCMQRVLNLFTHKHSSACAIWEFHRIHTMLKLTNVPIYFTWLLIYLIENNGVSIYTLVLCRVARAEKNKRNCTNR